MSELSNAIGHRAASVIARATGAPPYTAHEWESAKGARHKSAPTAGALEIAEAAIREVMAAMRKPSAEMLAAGFEAPTNANYAEVQLIWAAMLDTFALENGIETDA